MLKNKSAVRDEFSSYFFEVLRILDGKEKDPYIDFLATVLIEQGKYLSKESFLKRINFDSMKEKNKEIDNWYCIKKDKNEHYVAIKLINKLKEQLDLQEHSTNYKNN